MRYIIFCYYSSRHKNYCYRRARKTANNSAVVSSHDDVEPPVSKAIKTSHAETLLSRSATVHEMDVTPCEGSISYNLSLAQITQRRTSQQPEITRQLLQGAANGGNKRNQHFLSRRHSSTALPGLFTPDMLICVLIMTVYLGYLVLCHNNAM